MVSALAVAGSGQGAGDYVGVWCGCNANLDVRICHRAIVDD